jgi:hypothetical protein
LFDSLVLAAGRFSYVAAAAERVRFGPKFHRAAQAGCQLRFSFPLGDFCPRELGAVPDFSLLLSFDSTAGSVLRFGFAFLR